MARRKRSRSEDYDDSIERQFWNKQTSTKHSKESDDHCDNRCAESGHMKNTNSTSNHVQKQNNTNSFNNDNDNIERLREKKRAKRQRQKEKKLLEKKMVEEQEAAKLRNREEMDRLRSQEKKRKEVEKKVPSTNEFIQTHKGVKYCDVQVGNGPVIQDRKKVRVKYTLRANNKNGKILDSSGNFSFRMGKGEVISGWEIGLLRMRQGGVRHIIVPPKAGYGSKDIGGGAGAMLYFEVTLLQC